MDYFRGDLMAQAILLEAKGRKISYINRDGEIFYTPKRRGRKRRGQEK
jgi:hypothetical protein